MKLLRQLLAERTGSTLVEYAFIVGVIAVGSLVGVKNMGVAVSNSYSDTATAVKEATAAKQAPR